MNEDQQPLEERLSEIIERFRGQRVVVVGDLVADQFLYGEISRVSREAPVLIIHHERTETSPGGAANCAVNLATLGAQVALSGVIGADEAGQALLDKLDALGIDCRGIIITPNVRTTTKVRILAGLAHSTRQQVIRVDYESAPLSDTSVRAEICTQLRASLTEADAVIISDYNYGVADRETIGAVREMALQRGVPVLVDSRFRLADFPDFLSATPNEDEVEHLIGRKLTDGADLERAGDELRRRLNYRALLITRGKRGMLLLEEGAKPLQIDAVDFREAIDVTGAGDTVIAAFALALSSGAKFSDAAHLANHAGGLVVMKRGTASLTCQELLSSLDR